MGKWICKKCGHEVYVVIDYKAVVSADFVCAVDKLGNPQGIQDGHDAKKKIKELHTDVLDMVKDKNYSVKNMEHSMYECLNCGDFTGGEINSIAEWKVV